MSENRSFEVGNRVEAHTVHGIIPGVVEEKNYRDVPGFYVLATDSGSTVAVSGELLSLAV